MKIKTAIFGIFVGAVVVLLVYTVVSFGIKVQRDLAYREAVVEVIGASIATPEPPPTSFVVQKGSLAEAAGIQNGDGLYRKDLSAFYKEVYHAFGDTYTFQVLRNGQSMTITLDLRSVPKEE